MIHGGEIIENSTTRQSRPERLGHLGRSVDEAQETQTQTDHPPYSPDLAFNDFYLFPIVKINYVVNVFRAAKRPLMRSKCTFCRYLNQNGNDNGTELKGGILRRRKFVDAQTHRLK
ncbi:hypothetical protein EVAR_32977_1 [Eumeta japonica]|uniref:Histone-lysine N-methyltransferase SETMAR n=1 Tax=Eumeta variegata TaxID=151549 RepID=A0A4C1X0B5_EUMVA|nr:hypothetical protein EVAR_32977_1 [Eumeta japonica]